MIGFEHSGQDEGGDSFGEVWFYRSLGDQRFLEPGSGLYWQIDGEGYEPYPSRSLWDTPLQLRGVIEDAEGGFVDEPQFYDSGQFEGEPLRIAERTLFLPGSDGLKSESTDGNCIFAFPVL